MTRATITALLLAVSLSAACTSQRSVANEPVPDWLTALIQELENQPAANPPAYITRYDYRGQTVYYLPARCCDIPSNVYDAAGTIICHADGGISGGGDGRCTDFVATRKNEKTIWRDPRPAS